MTEPSDQVATELVFDNAVVRVRTRGGSVLPAEARGDRTRAAGSAGTRDIACQLDRRHGAGLRKPSIRPA